MKKLSFINKILFIINNIVAILLVTTFILPAIKPSSLPIAPVIGLFTPIIILANILFVCYWIIIGFKKQLILSLVVLILGYFISTPIYKFSSNVTSKDNNQLKILSYNIRKFNMYKWINDDNIVTKIADFIINEQPDIIALQEYKEQASFKINYPYSYNHKNYNYNRKTSYPSGLSIYSKYPIINQGSVDYRDVFSSIIYADIVKASDTFRIYNFHLESLGLIPSKELFGHKDSDRLVKKLGESFKTQQIEIDTLNYHLNKCNFKTIIAGDMNNTAYSWAYKNLRGTRKDTYLEAGKGFGKTYNFKRFPLRIDYIFVDEQMEVLQHKNYDVLYSDHFPISAIVSF